MVHSGIGDWCIWGFVQHSTSADCADVCQGILHDDVIKWKHLPRYWPFFFDMSLNIRLSKQWWGWWFETAWDPLWRHCNGNIDNKLTSCVFMKDQWHFHNKPKHSITVCIFHGKYFVCVTTGISILLNILISMIINPSYLQQFLSNYSLQDNIHILFMTLLSKSRILLATTNMKVCEVSQLIRKT